ncbi:MAG: hypothetical protein IPH18_06030 [Chitinophagaceae bacterium]|nr:hypothetical protein [Chitinophagaceae bacterium]
MGGASRAANPGNAASFLTGVAGVYSVIVTNTVTGCNSLISQERLLFSLLRSRNFQTYSRYAREILLPHCPTSLNSISGGWSPAVNNTATTFIHSPPQPDYVQILLQC